MAKVKGFPDIDFHKIGDDIEVSQERMNDNTGTLEKHTIVFPVSRLQVVIASLRAEAKSSDGTPTAE